MRRAAVYASTEPSSATSLLTTTSTSGTVSGSVSIRPSASLALIPRELDASDWPIWMSDM